ncbi:MAG: hypothetical protein J6Q80_03725 [Lentisphaeria bacterium]|nr:hypothetical protein [Lentisphaeria bacterium]
MSNDHFEAIREIEKKIEQFMFNSGLIGADGILNDYCYPQLEYFTHESYAASQGFPVSGWYRRENEGGNPNAMSYGFAIGEFSRIYAETGRPEALSIAEGLADHILKYQILDESRPNYGGFGDGSLLNDSAHQLPYGLLRLAELSEQGEKYRASAVLCIENFVLNHHFQRDENGKLTGVFFDFFSEERNRFESWGEPQRCAHSPLCFGFSLLAGYSATGNRECLDALLLAYDWLIREFGGYALSSANGINISPQGTPFKVLGRHHIQTVPRYTGYCIHTLLGAWHFSNDTRYIDEAVKCADLIIGDQRENGTFPLTSEIEKYFPNTLNGAYGYLGGTLHLLALATGNAKYEAVAQRAVAALKLDQCQNPEMPQYGGIFRRGGASRLEGMVHPFGYGWVADSFQTLLNLQGVTMIQEKDSYIGLRSDIPGFFAHLKQQGGK